LEITSLQKVADYEGTIEPADFARGEKVWFREMTGIKPLMIADVVSPSFIAVARRAYPGRSCERRLQRRCRRRKMPGGSRSDP
jgi:NitT/TauT family transport system substrate-binding protein